MEAVGIAVGSIHRSTSASGGELSVVLAGPLLRLERSQSDQRRGADTHD